MNPARMIIDALVIVAFLTLVLMQTAIWWPEG